MKQISREELAELLSTSSVRPRIKRELRFVPEEITDWENRDFLAVTNKSRNEGVLIAPLARMHVVPFRLQKRTPNHKGRVEAIICDICATWQRGSYSAILTFDKAKSSISFLVCEDLNCSLHVRDMTNAAKLSRTQLRETNTVEDRINRLQKRLEKIVAEI